MFFSKPKVSKFDGETAAMILSQKLNTIGHKEFLMNAETLVWEALESIAILKTSNNQCKQICQLAIRFHEHDVSYENNREKIPLLRDEILVDFR